jgi:hypothetical protein
LFLISEASWLNELIKRKSIRSRERFIKNLPNAGAYFGPDKLHRVLKSQGIHNIGKYTVKKWLQNQDDYSLQKPVLQTFKKARVVVSGFDNQFDADLADMYLTYAKKMMGCNIFFVIDISPKYLWVEPLNNKTAKEVVKGFQHIFDKGRKCKK